MEVEYYFKLNLEKYQDLVIINNKLTIFIEFLAMLIVVFMIYKSIKKYKKITSKSFLKSIVYYILIIGIYYFGEHVRGNTTLKEYLKKNHTKTIEGVVNNLSREMHNGGGYEKFYVDNKYFLIDIDKNRISDIIFFREQYNNQKNYKIKRNGQYIKIEYIEIPNYKICSPFFNYCYYSKSKSKIIIKLWTYKG